MSRPVIGICAAVEQARYGPWDELAALVPRTYPEAVQRAGGIAMLLPPDRVAEGPGGAPRPPRRAHRRGRRRHRRRQLRRRTAPRGDEHQPGPRPVRDRAGGPPSTGRCRFWASAAACRSSTSRPAAPSSSTCPAGSAPTCTGRRAGQWAEHEVRLEPDSLAPGGRRERLTVKSHHHQGVAGPATGSRSPDGRRRRDGRGDRVPRPLLRPRRPLASGGGPATGSSQRWSSGLRASRARTCGALVVGDHLVESSCSSGP